LATSTSHFALEAPLSLVPPGGSELPVFAEDLAWHRENGRLIEARLRFLVSPEEYGRIDREELLHLDRKARGPGSDRFDPTDDVLIEARLDVELLPELAALGEDILVAGPAFLSLRGSNLHLTESWWALHVTVEVLRDAQGGTLREGYSTLHGDSSRPTLALPALALAAGAFEERGIEWHETSDDEVIQADVVGDNGSWECYVLSREQHGRCTVYSQISWATPHPQMTAMMELLTRINFGLPVGNFELDVSDGELRFKTAIETTGGRLSSDLFENLLSANLAATDMYLPALEAVRDGRLTPEEAVKFVED
jgi:hypothetical protein